jgi:hypothetical protein
MKWLDFLKDYKSKNPSKTYKQCMVEASKQYKAMKGKQVEKLEPVKLKRTKRI